MNAQPITGLNATVRLQDIIVKEGEVISNILKVQNQSGSQKQFYLEYASPADWKILSVPNKIYTVQAGDSLFIPVRMLPNVHLMTGNTKYNVSVFLVDPGGSTMAMCSFNASKIKVVDWKMTITPRSRIYFLNDQYTTALGVNIANNGEETQDVNMSWQILGQGLTLSGPDGVHPGFMDFAVKAHTDTTIQFVADLSKPQRNTKRVDLENYRPVTQQDARRYTIYFRAMEPKSAKNRTAGMAGAELIKLNNSVDFVKLSNSYRVNNYGTSVIPITWYSNVYNILGVQPIALNILNLNMPVNNGGQLTGQLQHYFTFYSPGQETWRNIRGGLSYYGGKWNFSIGQGAGLRGIQVGGIGVGNAGSGVSLGYHVNNNLQVNSFYSISPGLAATTKTMQNGGAGISWNGLNQNLNITAGYTFNDFLLEPSFVHTAFAGVRYRFLKNQQFSFRYGKSIRLDSIGTPLESTRSFDNWLGMYSGSYFANRLNQSISFGQYANYILTGDQIALRRTFGTSRTTWNFTDGRSISLGGGYQYSESITAFGSTLFTSIPVSLQMNMIRANGIMVMPSLFYTYTEDNTGQLHFRGITYNTSYYSTVNNTKASFSFTGGYNKYSDSLSFKELFSATTAITGGFKTISAGIRYAYGPLGIFAVRNFHYAGMRYPQYIFSNMNYQYTFPNTHFVGDVSVNHSWNNQTYTNNFGISPQVYYFTHTGWRFNLRAYYSLNARNNDKAQEFYQYQGYDEVYNTDERITLANNFNLSVGLKKEFGIPVPKRFRKEEYLDVTFLTFFDFNGNKVMDKEEVPLENIVIRVGGHEVITDKEGKGRFINVAKGQYAYQIIPLIGLEGWFTYYGDSITITNPIMYIPFTRGVKVSGSVVLDREKYTKDVLQNLDLSGIRIFTTDTSGNILSTVTEYDGSFSFYVPYGAYVLSMDDQLISDRYVIAQNYIPMDLYDGMDGFYQSFFIFEKRRTVKKKKFNEKGEVITVEELVPETASDSTAQDESVADIFTHVRNQQDSSSADERMDALDERIDRLDKLINELKAANGNNNVDPEVLSESLKKLKQGETKPKQPVTSIFADKIDITKPYQLVIGGMYTLGDAEMYAQDLASRGFTGAVVIGQYSGQYLVRIGDFATREEAISAQSKFGYTLDGLWILRWPN